MGNLPAFFFFAWVPARTGGPPFPRALKQLNPVRFPLSPRFPRIFSSRHNAPPPFPPRSWPRPPGKPPGPAPPSSFVVPFPSTVFFFFFLPWCRPPISQAGSPPRPPPAPQCPEVAPRFAAPKSSWGIYQTPQKKTSLRPEPQKALEPSFGFSPRRFPWAPEYMPAVFPRDRSAGRGFPIRKIPPFPAGLQPRDFSLSPFFPSIRDRLFNHLPFFSVFPAPPAPPPILAPLVRD